MFFVTVIYNPVAVRNLAGSRREPGTSLADCWSHASGICRRHSKASRNPYRPLPSAERRPKQSHSRPGWSAPRPSPTRGILWRFRCCAGRRHPASPSVSTTRSPRGWAGGFQAREVLLGLTSQPTYRGSGRNAARPLRSPLPWPPAHEGARFVIRSVGQLNRWVSGPPLARQRVQGEVDVLVCRVQVERGTDPTSANGRPYPSGREHSS